MRLAGKTALVTGAGSGIGRAAALAFSAEGAKVVVADLDGSQGEQTVKQIQLAGGQAALVVTDVTQFPSVEKAVGFAVEHFGALNVMLNNAGTGWLAPLLDHAPADYDLVVKTNQYGVYHGILAAARAMKAAGRGGTILNTSSILAFSATHLSFAYQASKAAVVAMTRTAALELAEFNIRVVSVAPGPTDTPIIQAYKDMGMEALLARAQMRGRLLVPESIAKVMVFLATEDADGINGSTIMVDDGYCSFKQ